MIQSAQKELWGKQVGMEFAAEAHPTELEQARNMARILAGNGAEVSIEDVRKSLPNLEYGNWSGSVFKGKDWIPCGFVQAEHEGSHARIIRKWKLRQQ